MSKTIGGAPPTETPAGIEGTPEVLSVENGKGPSSNQDIAGHTISCDAETSHLQYELNAKPDIVSKGDLSVQDDDSNFGFIVIKPEVDVSSTSQEEENKEEDNQTPNVFIIQNPDEMDIDGFDPDVISQVRRVLAEAGTGNSVMILNETDCNDADNKDATTYIIDLNTVESAAHASTSPSTSTTHNDLKHHQNIGSLSPPTITSSTTVFKPLVKSPAESACDILNITTTSSDVSNQGQTDSDPTPPNVNAIIEESPESHILSNNSNHSSIPKNLNYPSQINSELPIPQDQSIDPSPSTLDSPSKSTVTTSQVAEQLIHIAKKMMEDSAQGSQKISVDESLGKIVISSPESKGLGEKSSTESVITMYLSSPNDLTMKLKKLKTNSPVIVMQAGEEPSPSDENKENPLCHSNMDENAADRTNPCQIVDPVSPHSDSLAAALSSLTSSAVLYRCSECGYSSHNKHYYKQHVDLVHNEDRPYKCPHCDYAGKRRHALLEHMVVHSNQRPYSCNHCNASFRKKGHLTNHVKLHMSHRLVHCGVCNIQLPDAEAFESHLRKIHNTDKLYKCKLCEHTVVDRRAMLTHLATHNESIVFSCPNCPSYFSNETSLLSHMKDTHNIIRKALSADNERSTAVSDTTVPPVASGATAPGADKTVQHANIVCSECGFMCTDTQMMKKHMWVHIDSSSESGVQLKDQASSKKAEPGGGSSNAMGVLKMNVVSGMKSLPENIVYQCTSCKFTSSDNSVFIKHMLLHKTQRKQQTPASKVASQPLQEAAKPSQATSITTSVSSSTAMPSVSDQPVKEKKTDSSVPFVFDQASGRYRCLICGYHCDYQRTIKAHIWKHSGNQNIEYPVFEQVSKSESATMASSDHPIKPAVKSEGDASSADSTNTSVTQVVVQPRVFNSVPGKNIQTLPFIPPTPRHGTQGLNKAGTSTPTAPTDKKIVLQQTESLFNTISAESIFSTIPLASSEPTEIAKSDLPVKVSLPAGEISPSSSLIIDDKTETVVEVSHGPKELGEVEREISVRTDEDNSGKMAATEEGCTEPSVVVEIVDSVPSSLGLTGMKSQQGSPRVSDLEGSGNDIKLAKLFKEMAEAKDHSQDISIKSDPDDDSVVRSKYDLRKPKDAVKPDMAVNRLKRAAIGDVLTCDSSSGSKELMESGEYSPSVKQAKTEAKDELKSEVKDIAGEILSNEESDGTASSDETVSAGEGGGGSNPPKSGICSSLLAVIEQLRERSRSESERDQLAVKELPKKSSKRSKKASNSSDADSLSAFHNIEKISEGGGEKFRCSLCHYTSQRICNMKIHMKTHRQKKPSECSLCDFASASPELLQEHMLQHCKVRTYACKFCPQSFNHKSTLRAHMRAHKDHEPFLCAYCVFETTNPNEYREHMHVHSGCSSRLRCPGCDYVMNSKDELTPHLMKCKGKPPTSSASTVVKGNTNKSDSSAKTPKPKESPAQTVEPQTSPAATSTHPTQHSCVVSGCSFSSISLKELQDHLSVHCNPSLMVCDLCDFKALHSRSLKSHMKRHANDQRYVSQPLEQYKCNLCGYVCHHLPSLKSHMWRHASDQSYSYEFTNDVINAAIDHDSRVDGNKSQPDDPELLVQFINSESRIMEGELTNFGKGDGQRPTCWVTFRCCSCGFETINKAKLNIHMRSHSDIIQQALDITPRKPGVDKSNHPARSGHQPLVQKSGNRRSPSTEENNEPFVPPKVRKVN